MKKFIKNNIAILISFTILFAFATFLCVKQVINDREMKQLSIEIKEECKDILEKGIENEISL